jgi:thioredoxin reductase (NADPH)
MKFLLSVLKKKPKRNEALEYYRRVAVSNGLNIHLFETVIDIQKNEYNIFVIQTSKNTYTAANTIIATGFYDIPNLLNIPGEDLPKVSHYYKDPHFYAGMNVVVVGASNSSVDAALECYRKGAKVTMIIRDSAISSHVKYWVKPDIENRIAEGNINALFNSNLTKIDIDTVTVDSPTGKITLPNDFVLALTGYRPDFDFLRKIGVGVADLTTNIPIYNTETMETNISNLYLAGVVCGGLNTHTWFIENSRIHAVNIIENISKNR